jgi:hypothetical protein
MFHQVARCLLAGILRRGENFMAVYSDLSRRMLSFDQSSSDDKFTKEVIPYLVGIWLNDYARGGSKMDVVETTTSGFSYLFDIMAQRLIAAWGISHGRHSESRDKARMAGHPLGAGPLYHRGHAIPHTLGGPTDINLVPQLGRINIGPFRPLEKQAVATPGSLYFTYWTYVGAPRTRDGHKGQTPTGVEQGLLVAGRSPLIERHGN